MSPKNKKKLNLLRKKLDYLDNDLLKLIKIRLNIVKKVLKLKSHRKEIVDKRRITFILKKVKKKSLQKLPFARAEGNPPLQEKQVICHILHLYHFPKQLSCRGPV